MNPPINFCHWRQQRRTAFLRFWLLMFVAPLLLAVGITLILRLTGSAEARIDAVLLPGGTTTRPQLTDNEATFAGATAVTRTAFATAAPATIYPRLAICAGSTGGAFTRARPLTTISWQQGTLEIKGLTTSITALNALETSLRQDASFHLNQRGATQQDAQGRWQFEYQLTRKVSDEHVL